MESTLAAIYKASMSYLWSMHTASAQDLEEAISGLLDVVHSAASETALKWNAETDQVWRRLPTELRTECFQDLNMRDKVALSHTSHMWRLNMLAIPSLWSTICCTESWLWDRGQLEKLLRRSGSYPLSLTLKPRIADSWKVIQQLTQNITRVKSLRVLGRRDPAPLMKALLLPAQTLPCLETLHVLRSDSSLWREIPKGLYAMLPALRSLHITSSFPGIFDLMPHLRELRCVYCGDTDGQRIFELCPNIEVMYISGRVKSVAVLPEGRPPASLHTFVLHDQVWQSPDMLEISQFFRPWKGLTALRHFELAGMGDLVTPTALFTSVCAGPWTLSLGGVDYAQWMQATLQGPLPAGEKTQHCFEVQVLLTGIAVVDAVLSCVPHFANLDTFEMPIFMLEYLVEHAISLPAVTDIRISTLPTHLFNDDGSTCVSRIIDRATGPQARRLRAPRLRLVTFITDNSCLGGDVVLAMCLHKVVELDAARLDRVIFSGVHGADLLEYQAELRLVRAEDLGYMTLSGFDRTEFSSMRLTVVGQ